MEYELTTGTVNADFAMPIYADFGTVNADFVRGSLIPNMHPFDGTSSKSIAILDNCSIHHVPEVVQLFEDAGILVIFLPPYSPDYNPIEETFSYIKYYLKQHELLQVYKEHKTILSMHSRV